MAHPRTELCAASTLLFLLFISISLAFIFPVKRGHGDELPLTFKVANSGPVAMFIGEGSHYDLESDQGNSEYAKLLPSGGHVIHTASSDGLTRPYTVTLFHQLKCLSILRNEHNVPGSEPLTHHCLTYLRQTILCRPNLRLESVRTPAGSASRGYDAVCLRDWTRVYEAAEENHAKYTTAQKRQSSIRT